MTDSINNALYDAGYDDYLILVTGNEADLTRIPLNDQLTADHAHQFGLAFHELLHVLKTAITAISELLEAEIDRLVETYDPELVAPGHGNPVRENPVGFMELSKPVVERVNSQGRVGTLG